MVDDPRELEYAAEVTSCKALDYGSVDIGGPAELPRAPSEALTR